MKWSYYIEEKPVFNQEIYFIRQYTQGKQTVCEGSYGIMKKDGVHLQIGSGTYSAGPCPQWDVTCWTDKEVFNENA